MEDIRERQSYDCIVHKQFHTVVDEVVVCTIDFSRETKYFEFVFDREIHQLIDFDRVIESKDEKMF